MREYNKSDLVSMIDPYEKLLLHTSSLIASRDNLEALSENEKVELVSRILSHPKVTNKALNLANEALHTTGQGEDCFNAIFAKGLYVHGTIVSMVDSHHLTPHLAFLETEFNADIFNQFTDLSVLLANRHDTDIASRLGICTPEADKKELLRNLNTIFRGSQFMTAVNGAFVLRNLLETLTGDNPELALTSRDFNVDLFHRFPELVSFYLKNKEQVIASTLALSTNPSQYGLISRKLEQLASSAIDPSNRFKLIQSEFNNLSEINRPTVETSKPSQVGFYANTPNTNKKTAIKSPLALIDSDDEDDKDIEDDLSTSCFSIPCCNLI